MRNGEYMDMKLLDEVKKMAALDQADKEFLKRTEKRMGHFLKEGVDFFFCFFSFVAVLTLCA